MCLFFHKWSKWEDLCTAYETRRDKDNNLLSKHPIFQVQERKCEDCNRREVNRVFI